MRSQAIIVLTVAAAAALAPARPAAAAEPAEKQARKRALLGRLHEIIKREPTVQEVQRAALAHYQLEPERIRSMSTAARLKGLFPEVDAGFDSTVGHNFSDMQDALYPTLPFKERQAASNDQTVWHVRGVWDLSRVVFNPEQLDIKTLGSLQESLIREVTTMYFSRRRVLAGLILSPPDDDEDLYYEQLRLDEMTATIDAFTGGKFAERAYQTDAAQADVAK
jgi:hypothetical protein